MCGTCGTLSTWSTRGAHGTRSTLVMRGMRVWLITCGMQSPHGTRGKFCTRSTQSSRCTQSGKFREIKDKHDFMGDLIPLSNVDSPLHKIQTPNPYYNPDLKFSGAPEAPRAEDLNSGVSLAYGTHGIPGPRQSYARGLRGPNGSRAPLKLRIVLDHMLTAKFANI